MSNSCQDFVSSSALKALEDRIKQLEGKQKKVALKSDIPVILGTLGITAGLAQNTASVGALNATLASLIKALSTAGLIVGGASLGVSIGANFKANNLANRADTNDSRVNQLEKEIFRLLNLLSKVRANSNSSGATADEALREAKNARGVADVAMKLAQQALSLAQQALNSIALLKALINGISSSLSSKFEGINSRLNNLASQISAILSRLTNTEGAVNSLRNFANSLNQSLKSNIDSINSRIDVINQKIDNVNKNISNKFNAFVNSINAQIKDLLNRGKAQPIPSNVTQDITNLKNQIQQQENTTKQKETVDNKKLDDIKKNLEKLLKGEGKRPPEPNRNDDVKRAVIPLFNAQTQQITNAIKDNSCCDITGNIDQRTRQIGDRLGDAQSPASALTLFGALKAFIASNAFDKALNVANFVMNTHNAIMLSRDLLETLGDVASNILGVIGIKDANGSPIDVSEQLGQSITNLITSAIGSDRYSALQVRLAALNRIYQATANVIDTVSDMVDSTRQIAETTGSYTGQIGNAIKEAGLVYENAYETMEENFENIRKPSDRFQKFIDGLEQAEDTASSISSVFSEVRSVQDGFIEIQEERQAFNQSLEVLIDNRSQENETIKVNSVNGSESFDSLNIERLGQ